MRTRSSFHFAPAQGNASYALQPPQPPQPKDIINYDRLLMLLLFVVVPFFWVLSWFSPLRGMLWLVFLTILGSIALMWLKRGFTPRGRMSMTAIFSLCAILALTGVLGNAANGQVTGNNHTVPPILLSTTPTPVALSAPQGISDSGDSSGAGDDATGSRRTGSSQCEQVLSQYLDYWKDGKATEMVNLTSHTWREKANHLTNGAEQALYSSINGKKLDSYTIEGEPTGTENNMSRTVSVLVDLIVKGEHKLVRYNALMLSENGEWLVDPNSLQSGMPVDTSTPAPESAGSAEQAATATPKATKKPSSKTKLYYNAKGGEYYHLDGECEKVAKKYLPLKSFKYGDLGKSPYNTLSPCPACGAPER